jgi:Zn-finger nucleic acid-binding protein
MAPEVIAEITLDRCLSCHGLWFDPTELDRYVQTPGRRGRGQLRGLRALPGSSQLTCPRCATISVDAFRAGTVYLSRCQHCHGVYLDGADLRALDGERLRLLPRFPSEPYDHPIQATVELALVAAAEVFLAAPF